MNYIRAISLCAAITITSGGLFLVGTPAFGRSGPILVTGAQPEEIVVRHVSYADLNLAVEAGQRTLDRRVGSAVTSLCTEALGGNDGGTSFRYSMIHCSNGAWNDARPQMARAIQRAQELALTGQTAIAATALVISLPK
jgi:UrcA family protein